MDLHRDLGCRRASAVSVVPLLAVGVSFFLPAVRACSQVTTPAHEVVTGAWFGLPPFVIAPLLAVATIVGLFAAVRLRRPRMRALLGPYRQHALAQEPPRAPSKEVTLGAMALLSAGSASVVLAIDASDPKALVVFGGIAACYVAALWRVVPRLDGWTRWAAVLGFWAVQAVFPVGFVLAPGALDPALPGATLYTGSLAMVVVALAGALVIGPLLRGRARRGLGASSSP